MQKVVTEKVSKLQSVLNTGPPYKAHGAILTLSETDLTKKIDQSHIDNDLSLKENALKYENKEEFESEPVNILLFKIFLSFLI